MVSPSLLQLMHVSIYVPRARPLYMISIPMHELAAGLHYELANLSSALVSRGINALFLKGSVRNEDKKRIFFVYR